jgi:ATP-binding cassette subfamily F protein 3
MISVENLTKSFGHQLLFEKASFKINSHERVGLVGRNGHGKTTLFQIITGHELYDTGKITVPRYYRIGYVRQQLGFTQHTVLKEGMRGLAEQERDHHWKVEKILSGLGFSVKDMHRHPNEFSGGYQVRLNLAKVLVSEPDLLLLDEPTNYLDIASIRWIERFLINWPHELMLITHDRGFMDKVITHVLGIHRKKIRKVPGTTEKYYSQIAQEEEVYEKTRINDERRQKEIKQFISRFRAKARLANLVQSRIKTLEKMEKRGKLEKFKGLEFSFRGKPFHGKYVLTAKDVFFSYDVAIPLIKDFSIAIGAGERICVIGMNGKGKTTLLRLLAGELTPRDGQITCSSGVTKGFFEQTNVMTLDSRKTVEEEILHSHPDVDRQLARNICGAMLFDGDAALKKIGVLSGGEKSRVMLGKILVTPCNLLILDEPTNHLDMESCDAMLAAIDNFDGTVVMVTHNEMFLHALAQRLIIFQGDRIEVFEGSYQRFLEKGGWENEAEAFIPASRDEADQDTGFRQTKKELRRKRSEIIAQRSKALKSIEQQIAGIEKNIEANEKDFQGLSKAMQKASEAQDGSKIVELSQALHNCQSTIERLFNKLETITGLFEEQKADFDKKLKQLERPGTV